MKVVMRFHQEGIDLDGLSVLLHRRSVLLGFQVKIPEIVVYPGGSGLPFENVLVLGIGLVGIPTVTVCLRQKGLEFGGLIRISNDSPDRGDRLGGKPSIGKGNDTLNLRIHPERGKAPEQVLSGKHQGQDEQGDDRQNPLGFLKVRKKSHQPVHQQPSRTQPQERGNCQEGQGQQSGHPVRRADFQALVQVMPPPAMMTEKQDQDQQGATDAYRHSDDQRNIG